MEISALAAASPLEVDGEAGVGSALTETGRAVQARWLAAETERLRWAVDVLAECEQDVPRALHGSDREGLVRSMAEGEVAATLGVSLAAAGDLLALGERLTTVMPSTLTALGEARIDVPRVRALVEAPRTHLHHQPRPT